MVQAGDRLRFTLEARSPDRVVGDAWREDLDGDVAVQPGVARAVDLAHAARADERDDFIRAEPSAGSRGHERSS